VDMAGFFQIMILGMNADFTKVSHTQSLKAGASDTFPRKGWSARFSSFHNLQV